MSDHDRDDDGGALVVDRPPTEDKERQRLEPPPLYAVVFLNDDFTPMEFVLAVLTKLFNKTPEEAEAITMEVHTKGKAIVHSYPKDIAETKATQVCGIAQQSGHPFKAETQALH